MNYCCLFDLVGVYCEMQRDPESGRRESDCTSIIN
jgi:hypothetical protein|nr:MAG TPA: hypothetical protein [Caudoviricetes sp.]DAR72401.1 MAG TPA: hypothetical protein [Caudoviricetes sp.]